MRAARPTIRIAWSQQSLHIYYTTPMALCWATTAPKPWLSSSSLCHGDAHSQSTQPGHTGAYSLARNSGRKCTAEVGRSHHNDIVPVALEDHLLLEFPQRVVNIPQHQPDVVAQCMKNRTSVWTTSWRGGLGQWTGKVVKGVRRQGGGRRNVMAQAELHNTAWAEATSWRTLFTILNATQPTLFQPCLPYYSLISSISFTRQERARAAARFAAR
eukprot:gene22953-biopygen23777